MVKLFYQPQSANLETIHINKNIGERIIAHITISILVNTVAQNSFLFHHKFLLLHKFQYFHFHLDSYNNFHYNHIALYISSDVALLFLSSSKSSLTTFTDCCFLSASILHSWQTPFTSSPTSTFPLQTEHT